MNTKQLITALIAAHEDNQRLVFDVILRLYHKAVARQQGIPTHDPASRRFIQLMKLLPQTELQRSAVDIAKSQIIAGQPVALPEFLVKEIDTLVAKLREFNDK